MLKSLKKTESHNSNGRLWRKPEGNYFNPEFYTQTLNQVHLYKNNVSDNVSRNVSSFLRKLRVDMLRLDKK